jgi:Cdc6-like AAA superfamily ATPase
MNMLETFQKFLKDREAADMYITGVAGTGKTTELSTLIEFCKENKVSCVTSAYTHKACNVLASKLPHGSNICTLHSYLKKRPTVNDKALKLAHVDDNMQHSEPDTVGVLFIDEFSMVGEKDYIDLVKLQYNENGDVIMKIVYIGDPNQLPPVKDQAAIRPKKPYWVVLTKIYRQADDNPLIDTLIQLNDIINGAKATILTEHKTFIRDQDIVKLYKEDTGSKIILAYTNRTVQDLNASIQGKQEPEINDKVFSPTSRKAYKLLSVYPETHMIQSIMDNIIELNSKYKTLETLHTLDVLFYNLIDEEGNESCRAGIFGHQNYLDYKQLIAEHAVNVNKKIEHKYKQDSKTWAQQNWSEPLAKERATAWKNYLSFNDNVFCIDFPHAMTVHKSQGSTYDNVYLDMQDLGLCADRDYPLYLKLLYVGISRAAKKVFTN